MLHAGRFALLILLFVATLRLADAQLPKSVQLDVLLDRLETAVETERWTVVGATIEELRELGTALPASVSFFEGKALYEQGRTLESLRSIELFLSNVTPDDPLYGQAISLYNSAETHPNTAKQRNYVPSLRAALEKVKNGCSGTQSDGRASVTGSVTFEVSDTRATLTISSDGNYGFDPSRGRVMLSKSRYTYPLYEIEHTGEGNLRCIDGKECISSYQKSNEPYDTGSQYMLDSTRLGVPCTWEAVDGLNEFYKFAKYRNFN